MRTYKAQLTLTEMDSQTDLKTQRHVILYRSLHVHLQSIYFTYHYIIHLIHHIYTFRHLIYVLSQIFYISSMDAHQNHLTLTEMDWALDSCLMRSSYSRWVFPSPSTTSNPFLQSGNKHDNCFYFYPMSASCNRPALAIATCTLCFYRKYVFSMYGIRSPYSFLLPFMMMSIYISCSFLQSQLSNKTSFVQ